jgi:hypothetical protein
MPNSLLTVTLASNFGTFILYALSCIICLVGFHNHPKVQPVLHLAFRYFGLVANLACMAFYLIGPFINIGTVKEPLLALGIAAVWGIYGGIYFMTLQQEVRPDDTGFRQVTAGLPDLESGPRPRRVTQCAHARSGVFELSDAGACATTMRITPAHPAASSRRAARMAGFSPWPTAWAVRSVAK